MAVEEMGEGKPVLLLHAWAETHRVFDRLAPLLSTSLRLVIPDQRGVGESDKPADGYGLADSAEDVIALLDALGIDSSWLVGTSSGGYLAQQAAVTYPERVRGLVLVGSPSNLHQSPPAAIRELLESLHDPVSIEDMKAFRDALPLLSPVPDAYVETQKRAALTIPPRVWRSTFDGLVAATPPIRCGPIIAPTLILWGSAEYLLPADQLHELSEAIKDSYIESYEGTGHLVLWERPERVAADIIKFISRAPN